MTFLAAYIGNPTDGNDGFRHLLSIGKTWQPVLMPPKPGEDIGTCLACHCGTRAEGGKGAERDDA